MRSWVRTLSVAGLAIGLIGFVGLLGAASPVRAESNFTARLTGAAEVPPVATAAAGSGCFTLSSAGLHFIITVDNLSGPIVAAHFHGAEIGVAGGVIRNLATEIAGNTITGIWAPTDPQPLDAAAIDALMTERLYVNVHTAANPGGEIRGQVLLSSGVHLSANLTDDQENPATGVPGTATASVTLTDEGLVYRISAAALTGGITAAHIHDGAIGVNGGVMFNLIGGFAGTTALGFVPGTAITAAQKRQILRGATYVNIHTAANPGGEIRGQLLLDGGHGFVAAMNGASEVPPTGAGELGTAVFSLTPGGLRYDVTVSGLSGAITAAHLHRAPTGVNGGVVRDLLPDFVNNTASGVWRFDDASPLTKDLVAELLSGNFYINVHTAANPGGEIRGQLTLASPNDVMAATLTNNQEEPPTGAGAASGTGYVVLNGANLVWRATVNGLTGAMTAAHFHSAYIGVNGGVTFNIIGGFVGNTGGGAIGGLTAPQVTQLMTGGMYINVHTAANPGGEIRGQVVAASGAELTARFTDAQDNNASGARATGTARLTPNGITFAATIGTLTGPITAAHFHQGGIGVPGGVVRDITPEFVGPTALGVWKPVDPAPLTPGLVTEALKNGLYLNLHTAAFPGGEARGQVTLCGGFGFGAMPFGGEEVPPTSSLGLASMSNTYTDQGLVLRTTVTGLTGAITAVHFHNAPRGVNGGVVRNLGAEFSGNTGDGAWKPSDASAFTPALQAELMRGNIYFNAHTAAFPAGEIRGQIGMRMAADVPLLSDGARFQLTNYPNPFVDRTTLRFVLGEAGLVRLGLYDASGRLVERVVNGSRPAGINEISLRAGSLARGVYFYRLETDRGSAVQKLVIADR